MPEGDTIFRTASALTKALVGRTVARFDSAYAPLLAVDDQAPLAGRTIEAVWSEGKHLLMRFSGDLTLRTHMRMSGSWHIYRVGEPWRVNQREMRIVIETAPQAGAETFVAVAFSVPVAEFLDGRALPRSRDLLRLGPDLLSAEFDPKVARERLRARPDRPMSEVLLDQSVAAGAGNVYRSESLFLAGLDPARPCSAVSDQALEALFALASKLMKANVGQTAAGGIVTYRGLRRTTGRSDEGARHWVYGRGGQPCRKCATPIAYRKTGPDARGLYYCPQCQRG
jgi:endonuclease-8